MKIEKKSIVFGIGAIFFLLVGFALGRVSIGIKSSVGSTPTATFLPTSLPSLTETPAFFPSFQTFKVTRIIDGDTIEIEPSASHSTLREEPIRLSSRPKPSGSDSKSSDRGVKQKVRYIGIDTPETVDPRKPVQCFGIEASKKNEEMVEGKNVRLEKDITDQDKYGRLLRYVWAGDLFVNLELVKQGFATSYTYPPDVKYQEEILAAEREAREAKRGLWGACPVISPTIEVEGTTRDGCEIKGNISASGEKIYHLPSCGSYSKTKIDESRGERWFCTEEEAQIAGWRKALNCP